MVLPEGFVIPSWYYVVPLVLGLAGVVALLWAIDPPVTDRTVIAFAPWMMLGSTFHVLNREAVDAFPDWIAPLFDTPSVYVTVAIVAGFVWIVANFLHAGGLYRSIPRFVGITGTAFVSVFAMIAIMLGYDAGQFNPFWPVVAIVITGVVTALAWIAVSLWFTDVAAITGITGSFVIFSQVLDGVSTAIGYDLLDAHEEVPLSLLVLEAGESLPTAELLGAGWLFVLVKLGLALVVVGLFTDLVRDRPRLGRLALAFVAAVGLGPGFHNVLLFTIT
ncbi:DUF63 family protein [Halovivax gelatinilyticus]|uniref:DUF63 family protein n=1 Tax=Halovivax gelatinilyticus TaxID=2961597 RepID=UPI0020CA2DCD|nr:DUF63 family protein [Halovivax gelatinilyticus]